MHRNTSQPEASTPEEASPTTVAQVLAWGAQRLAGVADRPRLEAERLLAAVLQTERATLLAHPEMALKAATARVYADTIRRRSTGLPLPYILGRAAFRDLDLVVTPDVLIPRPETELLVERALAWLAEHPQQAVVDVGTGSGCIAVSLALAAPDARIYAIDISAAALAVARTNALRYGVARHIRWVQADLLSPFATRFGLVVSNPPYVAETEWAMLSPSVRQEPRLALLGGPEGLTVIERLLSQIARRLQPDGCALIEIGETQANAVLALARTAFEGQSPRLVVYPDLAGRDRMFEVCLGVPA